MNLISLVGEQPIPNLLPLWQDDHFSQVIFCASETTYPVAQVMEQVIAQDPGLQHIQLLAPFEVPAYDLPQAVSRITYQAEQIKQRSDGLMINLTGGTKLMSMAAMLAARQVNVPFIYVSTEEGVIITFDKDGIPIQRQPISVTISAAQYLRAHGLEVSDNQAFNPDGPYSNIAPPKEGDWLEETLRKQLAVSGLFDDVQRGMFIRREEKGGWVNNELDVVATRNGRLAVCSCKSGENITNDHLYELSSLSRRESAGIYCVKVLVLARETVTTAFQQRAKASGILLITGRMLPNAAEHIGLALSWT